MRFAPADALFYVCGPGGLIKAARKTAHELGIAVERLQYENFE
jgi:ferredoxin-NADP reductase